MSHRACGEVYELDLPPNEKFVLVAMADHADHNFRNIRPSIQLIAAKTNYSERQIQRYIKDFEVRGILVREKEGFGRGNTAVFRLNVSGVSRLPYFVQKRGENDDEERVTSQVPCQGERVTSGDVKGDISSSVPAVKGDIPCHPNSNQVTRTVTEGEKPAGAGAGSSGGSSEEASEHRRLIDAWVTAYAEKFGTKYFFSGAKDGSAATRLLKTGDKIEDIIALAKRAWSELGTGFLYQQSTTIAGFASKLNEINAMLNAPKSESSKPSWMQIRDLENEVRPLRAELEEWNTLLQSDANRTVENLATRKGLRERVEAIDAKLAELRKA